MVGAAAAAPAPCSLHARASKRPGSIRDRRLIAHPAVALPCGPPRTTAAVPAAVEDRSGRPCLLVLPSDRPAPRAEAAAVEALLGQLLAEPPAAARAACEWRAAALSRSCAGALAALGAAAKGGGNDRIGGAAMAGPWQLRGPCKARHSDAGERVGWHAGGGSCWHPCCKGRRVAAVGKAEAPRLGATVHALR
jgi:hypothetical protein